MVIFLPLIAASLILFLGEFIKLLKMSCSAHLFLIFIIHSSYCFAGFVFHFMHKYCFHLEEVKFRSIIFSFILYDL